MSGRQTNILVVGSATDTREDIDLALRHADFDATLLPSLDEVEKSLLQAMLLLVELDLTDAGSEVLIRKWRADYPSLGIVVMAAQNDELGRIVLLEAGADDVIQKPFRAREVIARVRNVLRRISDSEKPASLIRFQTVEIDTTSQVVTRDNEVLGLTGHEFRLLTVLASRPERVFTREELSRLVSDKAWHPNDRSIDVLVSKLRKKVETDSRPIIRSLRGVGYQFAARVDRSS